MNINTSIREKISRFFAGISKKFLAFFVLFFIFLTAGVTYYFVSAAAPISGTQVTISRNDTKLYFGINGNDKYTYRYNVKYTSGQDNEGNTRQTYEAVCAETDKKTPNGLTSAVYDISQEISATKYEQIKRIHLTTYIGRNFSYNGANAYNDHKYNWEAHSKYANNKSRAVTSVALGHVLVSYIYSGSTTGFSASFANSYWKGSGGLIQNIYNIFESEPYKSLAEHVVVRRSEGTAEKQDLIWLEGVHENPEGELGIEKVSGDPSITDGNSYYQLNDAVFEIYNDDDCSGETIESDVTGELIIVSGSCSGTPVATLTTGSNGKTPTVMLPIGSYWIKEITSPRGYRLDTDIYRTTVIDGDTVWFESIDDPIIGGVKIKKVDSETLGITPQGGASLAGAKFGLYNLNTWETIADNITIESDGYAEYYDLAPGSYKIKELTPGTGYVLNEDAEISFTIDNNTLQVNDGVVDLTGAPMTNQVIRGDFKFTKYAKDFEGNSRPMAGIPFLITANYGGVPPEQHIIMSDSNGVVNTSAHRCININANDSAILSVPDSQWSNITSSSLDQNAGVWFGGGSCSSSASGALPYGTYTVQEIKISDNDAYDRINFTVTISSDGTVVDEGTKTNIFVDNPNIRTVATGSDGTSKKIEIGSNVTITDKVIYSGLTAGVGYTLNATLYDQNGNVAMSGGNPVTGTKTFTAGTDGAGETTVDMTLDTSAYIGQNLSIFEELFRKGTKIAEHNKTLTDADQTVQVKSPYIKSSTATASDGSSKNVGVGIETIIDKVTLFGLVNGSTYKIRTTAKTAGGTAVKLLDGANEVNYIETSYSYTGTTGGQANVTTTLKIDTTKYKATDLIIYQELFESNGTSLGIHPGPSSTSAEIAAETVTVKTPSLATNAYSGEGAELNNDEISVTNHASIRDRVKVTGLVKNTTYTLTGKVVSAENTSTVLATVTGSYTMTSDSGEEYWYMDFDVNTLEYPGKQLVIFEYLSRDGIELARHEDANDTNQIVRVKEVGIETNAENADISGSKTVGVGTVNIKDTVTYWGLVDGDTYTLSAQLIRKDNSAVVAEATGSFNADSTATTNVMFYNVDTSNLIGKQIVVVERLYKGSSVGSDDNKVAEHVSLNDADQTITVSTPTLGTTAWNTNRKNTDDEKKLRVGSAESITDTVTYSGLVAGQTYKFTACLYDGDTKQQIAGSTCRAEDKTLTAASGSLDILIGTIDTYNLIGKKVVVKETVTYNGVTVAEHDVLRDGTPSSEVSAQTLTVKTPALETTAWNTEKKNTDDEKKLDVGYEESISDTIRYSGLIRGQTYRFTACIYDGDTKQQITQSLSQEGSANADCQYKDQTLSADDGTVDVLVGLIDTYDLIGKKIVVKETVTYNGVTVAEHDVLRDGTPSSEVSAQTLTVKTPAVGTVATDKFDNNTSLAVGTVTIKDLVHYSGLKAGEEYTLETKLVDGSGRELRSTYSGVNYTVTNGTFTAAAGGTGDVVIEIVLDDTAKLRANNVESVTIYEYLKRDNNEIAKHEVIGDTQTLEILEPTLETDAVSGTLVEGNGNKVVATNTAARIIDTVSYTGLSVGTRYKVTGKLYDQTTGNPLEINGREVTSEVEFTAETENGEVELIFTLDTTHIPGKDLVAFEKLLSKDGIEIAKHEVIDDLRQWVEVQPRVGTKVVDVEDGDQAVGVGIASVRDTVHYEGLRNGKTYMLVGVLVDRVTGEPIMQEVTETSNLELDCDDIELGEGVTLVDCVDGSGTVSTTTEKPISGKTMFTIGEQGTEAIDGNVKVDFEFDSTGLQGRELVVYEELYSVTLEGEEISGLLLVAEHKDLRDEEQFIDVKKAKIGTTAVDAEDGDKELDITDNESIVDTVEYYGLIPGNTYRIVGELMNKETGESLKIQRELDFEAEAENGVVELKFGIDTTDLSGKEIVTFETLYYVTEDEDGEETTTEIADHKDLNDQKQTVWVKVITPNTGMFGAISEGAVVTRITFAGIILGALGATYAVISRKRKIRF